MRASLKRSVCSFFFEDLLGALGVVVVEFGLVVVGVVAGLVVDVVVLAEVLLWTLFVVEVADGLVVFCCVLFVEGVEVAGLDGVRWVVVRWVVV